MRVYLILLLFLVFSCKKQQSNLNTLRGEALGTTYSIKYFSDSEKIIPKQIDSILQVINSSMSTYKKDSDISKINAGDTTIQVDKHFEAVFLEAKAIYKNTKGYFDPSVGLLVNAYGFGPEGYSEDISDQQIDSLYQLIGLNKIELTSNNTISTENEKLYLDFNAIAKGYTVDVFGDFLNSRGFDNYLVEIGGEVKVQGLNKDRNSAWKVGIELPEEDSRRELMFGVELTDQALATSGNYRKFRVDSSSGKKFVHTINPKTGKSQKSDILSASVVAETCAKADAYATALMAMGYANAKDFLEVNTEELQVVLVYVDAQNQQQTFISEGLRNSIEEF